MTYRAPLADISLALKETAKITEMAKLPAFADMLSDDLVDAIVTEAAKLAEEEIAPTNVVGDRQGAKHNPDGTVTMPDGFPEAYAKYAEGGWLGLSANPEYGGQGLPITLSYAVQEMVNSANLAFGLPPILSMGASEAINAHGTDEQKALYLPNMAAGSWTGTMNLTEPQAGSDLGAITSRAEPQADGTYRIFGTKIFITSGEHNMSENIIHLVLARLPDAPAGSRGISLFIVPKFLPNEDGSLGARNDLICQSVEEKLGIHASPTCVMSFGEKGEGATGWMLGPPNKGLSCMFTMMNNARLHMGVQSAGISERAYQHALAYATDRKQGKAPSYEQDGMAPIIHHPDVRKNLLTMKTLTQAMRAISYRNAAEIDRAHHGGSEEAREMADLLTPISKAWCSDYALEVTSIGVQIHGGMGFVEETGAAQYYRDARIIPIYEGTNGIQAIDLVGRKLPMKNGGVVTRWLDEAQGTADKLAADADPRLVAAGKGLGEAIALARKASTWLLERAAQSQEDVLAGATSYLRLMGHVSAAHLLGEQSLACDESTPHGKGKRVVLTFFSEQFLPEVQGLAQKVESGASTLMTLSEDELSA